MATRILAAILLTFVAAVEPRLRAEESPAAPRLGDPVVSQWQFGVKVNAPGAVTGIVATLPVPMDWPEQTVKIVKEEKSPGVGRISYRTLDGGVLVASRGSDGVLGTIDDVWFAKVPPRVPVGPHLHAHGHRM